MYLWRRPSGYLFQMRIPVNRVKKLGKSPLRIPLGRLSALEAQRRATILAGSARLMMEEETMSGEALSRSLSALSEELALLGKQELSLGVRAVSAIQSLDDIDPEHRDQIPIEMRFQQQARVSELKGRKAALASFRKRLEVFGADLGKDRAAWEAERGLYERMLATARNMETNGSSVVHAANVEIVATTAPTSEFSATRDTLFSVAAAPILAARKEALEADGSVSRYAERLHSAVAAFIDVIGDRPLSSYLPLHIQQFATVMGRVPANRTKHRPFKGLSLREMANRNDAMGDRAKPRLATSTIQSYITEILSTWRNATAGVHGVNDIGQGSVTMPRSATQPIDREGLRAPALNKWFADAATSHEPHVRWMPLIAYLTGMRLAEIVYLQRSDFVEIEGNLVIDLRRKILVKGRWVDRPLKNKTSKRIVALHTVLNEAGFVEWALKQSGFLFNDFHSAKNPSDAAQKRMAHWMERLEIRVRQREVFHSVRHSTKAWLRPHVGERTAGFQCGHAPGSVGAKYGFRCLEPEEVAQVMATPHPRGVDFSPYLK